MGKKAVGLAALAAVAAALVWLLVGGGPTGLDGPASPKAATGDGAGPSPASGATAAGAAAANAAAANAAAANAAANVRGSGGIRGRLVRGRPPVPLSGAVTLAAEELPSREIAVGPDGRFDVGGLPAGSRVDLVARAPGLHPARLPGLALPASGPLDVGDVLLGVPQSLVVHVRDARDHPVAGARVSLHRIVVVMSGHDWTARRLDPPAIGAAEAQAATGADGVATLDDVATGAYRVVAEAEGFAPGTEAANLVEEKPAAIPLVIVLRPGHALAGTVYDPAGRPAPGLVVRASDEGSAMGANLGPREATTSESGEYRIEGLAAGAWGIAVRLDAGTVLDAGAIRVPGVERFDIHLPAGGTLEGVVLDDGTGEAVAGATVDAWKLGGEGPRYAARRTTRPDGTFRFEGVPDGSLYLVARGEGYVDWPDSKTPLPESPVTVVAGEVSRCEVRLRRGAALAGRVLDPDGRPIAGARIVAHSRTDRTGSHVSKPVRSGADGRYRIEDLERGITVLVAVTADGYFSPGVPGLSADAPAPGSPPAAGTIEIPETGDAALDLVLAPGGTVRGVAAFADGRPAAGCSVTVRGGEAAVAAETAAVAADGSFSVRGVGPGESLTAAAWGPGGVSGRSEPFALAAGQVREGVRIVVGAGAAVAGVVRFASGDPAPGALLRLVSGSKDPREPWKWQAQLGRASSHPVRGDGSFRIEGLEPGRYTLLASAAGAASAAVPFEVRAGEERTGVSVDLAAGLVVAGRVLGDGDRPLAGAAVVALAAAEDRFVWTLSGVPADAVTDGEGRFEVRDLPAGAVTLSVSAPGLVGASRIVAAGTDDVLVRLSRGGAIGGVVVDEGTGRPIAGLRVLATVIARVSEPTPLRPVFAETDGEGRFLLDGLEAGSYVLTVGGGKDDHVPQTRTGVATGTTDLRFELARGLVIAGRLVDERGRAPAASLRVFAAFRTASGRPDYGRQRSVAVDPDGRFRIDGLVPGRYDLTVSGAAYVRTTTTDVAAGATDLVIAVREGKTIAGRVVDGTGEPWTGGGFLRYTAADGTSGTVAVGPEGRFETEPLDPSLRFDLSLLSLGVRTTGVAPGREDVLLRMAAGGTIAGVVLDERERPVGAGVRVGAQAVDAPAGSSGDRATTMTDPAGRFTLANLGPFRFRVEAGGGGSDWQRTEVEGTVEPGARDLEIRVSRGFRISGSVVDAEGSPRRSILVQAVPATGVPLEIAHGFSGNGGDFVIRGLPPGPVRLRLRYDDRWIDGGPARAPSDGVVLILPE